MEYEIYKRFAEKISQGLYLESVVLGNTLVELITAGNQNHGEFFAGLLYNLGGLNLELNRSNEAVSRYKEAAAEYESLNDCQLELANALTNLGVAQSQSGCHDESVESFKKVLEVKRVLLGEKHMLTAQARYNLGNAYVAVKNFPAAKRNISLARACEFSNKSYRIDVLFSLALISEAEGNMSSAIDIFTKTLAFQKETYGENSFGYIANLSYLASMHAKTKDYTQAAKKCQKAVNILNRISPSHPNLTELLEKLSDYYYDMDRTEKAIASRERAISHFRKLYGDYHVTLSVSLNRLAALYRKKDMDKSLKIMKRSLKIIENVTGTASLPYIRELISICLVCFEEGLPDETTDKLIREAIRKIKKSAGEVTGYVSELNQLTEILKEYLSIRSKVESIKPNILPILELLKKIHSGSEPFSSF